MNIRTPICNNIVDKIIFQQQRGYQELRCPSGGIIFGASALGTHPYPADSQSVRQCGTRPVEARLPHAKSLLHAGGTFEKRKDVHSSLKNQNVICVQCECSAFSDIVFFFPRCNVLDYWVGIFYCTKCSCIKNIRFNNLHRAVLFIVWYLKMQQFFYIFVEQLDIKTYPQYAEEINNIQLNVVVLYIFKKNC